MRRSLVSAFLLSLALLAVPAAAQVSLTTLGSAVTQNFDTLANTGTSGTTPTGWAFSEVGTAANTVYTAGTGSLNTGDTYSFGAAANSERAFGGVLSGALTPTIGASFQNNTGATITSLAIAYNGEQWRLGATGRNDRLDFQISTNATSLTTGTWVDADTLDFIAPIGTGTAGPLDGNAAANRTAVSSTIASLSIANGATFWIRWNDFNATGADDGLGVDDFSLTPNGGGPPVVNLSINDVSLNEGNAGTTNFIFTVSLSAPAGPGGVTFTIATADGTATVADNDYVANTPPPGQTIPAGSSTFAFTVLVNGDTTTEANQTFFVNVTSVTGATVTDGQGLGTIVNDDVSLTPIHDIQGPGASSPIVGASVTTRGIVTGLRSNGFFLQEPDASVDADPATSEGVLVFTSSAPPAAAAVGNLVQVTGTVTEFVPSADPLQPPLTELTSPTVALISSGNPLPTPVPLTATFPNPAGPFDQLERIEGMRASVTSLTIVGPTLGAANEPNATSASTGVFFGVVTGVPRPFREAGIPAPDPAPSGSIPPIPRFDTNPERIRVDSDALGGFVDVGTGAVVTGLVGPVDYTFRTYTILPDAGVTLGVTGGPVPTAVTDPLNRALTVASFNVERLYDTTDDAGTSDVVVTPTAFANRLNKISLALRNQLKMPDIVGMVEVENLTTLQAVATKINNDAVAAGQPNPMYTAHLVEGNDIGGIDVGFMVKTAIVSGATPRVTVNAVVQEGSTTTYVSPTNGANELLNDRPPLRLAATVHHPNGNSVNVTVIANHLRSLNDVNNETPQGASTTGGRVRAKRRAQAEFLANLVQTRQTADPTELIVLVGDFNAFEVNDGLVDLMGTIVGAPTPAAQVVLSSADLVNPNLFNLTNDSPAADRYSYVFDGNAQTLDHVLINNAKDVFLTGYRTEHPRIDADFPATDKNDPNTPRRISDHDPVVAYFDAFPVFPVELLEFSVE